MNIDIHCMQIKFAPDTTRAFYFNIRNHKNWQQNNITYSQIIAQIIYL